MIRVQAGTINFNPIIPQTMTLINTPTLTVTISIRLVHTCISLFRRSSDDDKAGSKKTSGTLVTIISIILIKQTAISKQVAQIFSCLLSSITNSGDVTFCWISKTECSFCIMFKQRSITMTWGIKKIKIFNIIIATLF